VKTGRSAGRVGLVIGVFFLGIIFAFGTGILGDKAVAGNNAGAAFSVWPDTGQTKCYDNEKEIPCPAPGEPFYGQDAQYQGPQRSYTKLGHGGVELPDSATIANGWIMTRDNVTGLIWEIKTDDGTIHDKDNIYTWCDHNPETNGGYEGSCGDGTDTEDFVNALNSANFGGYSDWRLPTVKELSTLVNSGVPSSGPTIDTTYFPNTMSSDYLSSTTNVYSTNDAWRVNFYFSLGIVGLVDKDDDGNLYVRAVRSGQDRSFDHLVDNHDGTITDTATGLMWQKCSMGQTYNTSTNGCDGSENKYTWQQALAACEGLELAGYNDWRLPNRNELQSILDYSRYNLALDTAYFPTNIMSSDYWSSTTYTNNTSEAWPVYFFLGGVMPYVKDYGYSVRAVRSIQSGSQDNSALPLPHGVNVFNYQTEETTKRANEPANCKPMAFKVDSGILTLAVDLPAFASAVDLYLGIYAPVINPNDILLIVNNGGEINWLSNGLKTWLSNTIGNINQPVSLYVKPEDLPQGNYYFYLLTVPANDLSLANYYLWSTTYVKN